MRKVIVQTGIVVLGIIIADFFADHIDSGTLVRSSVFPWVGFALMVASLLLLAAFSKNVHQNMGFLSFLSTGIVASLAPTDIDQLKFYEVTAQVVPVLFLALAVEHRAFRIAISDSMQSPFMAWIAVALAGAEFECLRVVVLNDAHRGSFDLVSGALAGSAVSLILLAYFGPPEPSRVKGDDAYSSDSEP